MMSFAYKVDELLALRDSVSESAVSIEKFPDEDVIRGQCQACPPLPFTFHLSPFTFPIKEHHLLAARPAYVPIFPC
jgi:hypothetical protein